MSKSKTKKLVSILMESPLYLTLSVKQRQTLLDQLAAQYPHLQDTREEEREVGYESSWSGAIH
ncbi:MAG: hypothetical protein AB1553_15440 [Nitrospirota bacterium]